MSKIVFYVNAINGGGAERVMVNLAKYFSENGYDTTLVTSFRDTKPNIPKPAKTPTNGNWR